jgi:hypothetical protein
VRHLVGAGVRAGLFTLPDVDDAARAACARAGIPALLFACAQIPVGWRRALLKRAGQRTDGPTDHVVVAFRPSSALVRLLSDGGCGDGGCGDGCGPGVRLAVDWLRAVGAGDEDAPASPRTPKASGSPSRWSLKGPSSPPCNKGKQLGPRFDGRLKVLPVVTNMKRLRLGRVAEAGNGTPFLVAKSGKYYHRGLAEERAPGPSRDGPSYAEVDVDVSMFKVVAVKLIQTFRGRTRDLEVEVGLVVQADETAELPEQVLAAARLRAIDLAGAPELTLG